MDQPFFIQGGAHSGPGGDQRDQWVRAEQKPVIAVMMRVILIA